MSRGYTDTPAAGPASAGRLLDTGGHETVGVERRLPKAGGWATPASLERHGRGVKGLLPFTASKDVLRDQGIKARARHGARQEGK